MKMFDVRKKECTTTFISNTEDGVRCVQHTPHNMYQFAASFDNGCVQVNVFPYQINFSGFDFTLRLEDYIRIIPPRYDFRFHQNNFGPFRTNYGVKLKFCCILVVLSGLPLIL